MSSSLSRHVPKPDGLPRLPEEYAQNHKTCANCHSPKATRWCLECNDADLGDIRVWYCNDQCQKQHWPEHEASCLDRRRLIRMVGLFEPLWDDFERLTFGSNLHFAEQKSKGVIQVSRLHANPRCLDPRGWTGESVFHPFPGNVVPASVGKDVERVILYNWTCQDVFFTGLCLVETLFSPLCKQIHQETVFFQNPAVVAEAEGEEFVHTHDVMHVELSCGEEYAIDMTGAQFGWQEKVYTWDNYLRYRGKNPENPMRKALGVEKMMGDEMVDQLPAREPERVSFEIKGEIALDMDKLIQAFFTSKKTTARAFVSQPAADFATQRVEFLNSIKKGLRQIIHDLTVRRGIGRLYVHLQHGVQAVRDEEEARKLSGVWLTKAEYEERKDDQSRLLGEWRRRVKLHQCQDVCGTD